MKKLDSKNINRRGAKTQRKSFIVGDAINAGANEIAPAKNINNQENSAPLRLCG